MLEMSSISYIEHGVSSIQAKHIRYIKLGSNGAWAHQAFQEGYVYFGAEWMDHDAGLNEDWALVSERLARVSETKQGQAQGLRQVKAFYNIDKTLWVTMSDGHVWWALSEGPPNVCIDRSENGPSQFRETLGGWSKCSVKGRPLLLRNISSALSKTAGYRRTICDVEAKDYLLRLINDQRDPLQTQAEHILKDQNDVALKLIKKLHWSDFETLIDLIFTRNGWRRSTVLGQNLPDVDFIAEQSVTGSSAWVQIKAATTHEQFFEYLDRFKKDGSCTDFFFICHTVNTSEVTETNEHHHFWDGKKVAEQSVKSGLFSWLIEQI